MVLDLNMNSRLKNDDFGIKNDDFCIKNDDFGIKNDDFCICQKRNSRTRGQLSLR